MDDPITPARTGEEYPHTSNGGDWLVSWHPPGQPPEGKRHGSGAVCYTDDGRIALVSHDGRYWQCPAGRPEGAEDWRQTLEREVLEEACARVEKAELLGFGYGRCLSGHEQGLALVRSLWAAAVSLDAWAPAFEMIERRLVAPADALATLTAGGRLTPVDVRWLAAAQSWARAQNPTE